MVALHSPRLPYEDTVLIQDHAIYARFGTDHLYLGTYEVRVYVVEEYTGDLTFEADFEFRNVELGDWIKVRYVHTHQRLKDPTLPGVIASYVSALVDSQWPDIEADAYRMMRENHK